MSKLKLIHAEDNGKGKVCKVYRDSEWGEYQVRLYIQGSLLKEANYHTDDKDDACNTARSMINE
ncbi:hypothetical protein V8U11_11045 [Pseudomonas chlororaphis]|uniref:hypothetical protein n=1 Tax=Pseudomonas chlororaphis TaxID=587753 RepID=UPI0030CC2EA0